MDPLAVSEKADTDCYACIYKTTPTQFPTLAPVVTPSYAPATIVLPTYRPSNVPTTRSVEEAYTNLYVAVGVAIGGFLLVSFVTFFSIVINRKRNAEVQSAKTGPPTRELETGNAETVSNLDQEEFAAA